ncbi:hypothetical protein [Rhizobium gallicum]|uniref:hypothetical protein n=1 Tax=Rhizobium gallicum TaxID=56730 RepID=UPI00193A5AE5|nr:hypothetical protein [Rhizobium gallicum]
MEFERANTQEAIPPIQKRFGLFDVEMEAELWDQDRHLAVHPPVKLAARDPDGHAAVDGQDMAVDEGGNSERGRNRRNQGRCCAASSIVLRKTASCWFRFSAEQDKPTAIC